jgi:putative drug exporter of the RND superfamily
VADAVGGRAGHGSRRLHRLGATVARRPRRFVVGWLLLLAVLGLFSTSLDGHASTRAIFVDGSESKEEHDIAVRQFGSEAAVVVLLRGPSAEVERQGRRLQAWYESAPGTAVVSPWTAGGPVEGLEPSRREAALIVNVKGKPTDDVTKTLPRIEQGVDRVVSSPVSASIAGAPALLDSIQQANNHAAELGQLIAFPVLIVVLLLVFRSVFAAMIPIVVGGTVIVASRGMLDLVARVVHVEILAVGAMAMMGLALGVDYALLIVSRFREEIAKGAEIPDAVAATTATTGRAVLMAGGGLSLAMLVSPFVLTGDIVVSISVAVFIATALSVLSALFVVPAVLTIMGTRLDSLSLPRRKRRVGLAAGFSERLSNRPLVIVPILLFLILASAWALTLDTGALAIAQLPRDDSGRLEEEDVQRTLGRGWVAPMEIAIESTDGPVTEPARMHEIVDFQRRLEKDPGVATVSDVAALAASVRPLEGLESTLAGQERSLAKLNSGISRLHRGASQSTSRLKLAANGAGQLDSGLGATGAGAAAIGNGLAAVSEGSGRMTTGLDKAGGGSDELVDGTAKASKGAEGLAAGLERAGKQTADIENTAATVENAMREGEARLDETDVATANVDASLSEALSSLRAMTVGKSDSRYESALDAVEAAILRLSGRDPATDEDTGAADTVATSVRRARGQFDLGLYLAGQMAQNGEKASDGVAKLADGSEKLETGLRKLDKGAQSLSKGIAKLSDGSQALSPALVRLLDGAERLSGGLGTLQDGAHGLAGGLATGSERSNMLVAGLGKIGNGVAQQRKDSSVGDLLQQVPGFFRSGYLFLAGLDGAPPEQRSQAGSVVSLRRGGSGARVLVITRFDPTDPRSRDTRHRIEDQAANLARVTGAKVVVGGAAANQQDIDSSLRVQTPRARLALAGITMLVLLFVLRSLLAPFLAGVLNLFTVAATFGVLALLFDDSLLGGPGYVDTTILPAAIVVIFGLAIDYEVFVFSRMREEYLNSGSTERAIAEGVVRTAPVVTGAAIVMIVVFISFSMSSFTLMRDFGVAQAVGVAIDAFLIRLLVIPAMMRAMGKWAWWMPSWLDRILPGPRNPAPVEEGR